MCMCMIDMYVYEYMYICKYNEDYLDHNCNDDKDNIDISIYYKNPAPFSWIFLVEMMYI